MRKEQGSTGGGGGSSSSCLEITDGGGGGGGAVVLSLTEKEYQGCRFFGQYPLCLRRRRPGLDLSLIAMYFSFTCCRVDSHICLVFETCALMLSVLLYT